MSESGQAREKIDAALVSASAAANGPPGSSIDLPTTLGSNLRRLRIRQGYSLDRLAHLSGVSRAMIGQIETAKSVPTISLLCRVAEALDVEFVNLLATHHTRRMVVLRREQAKTVEASAGKFTMRALFQQDRSRVKFFEVRIAPLHTEVAEPWASGTHAKLVVTRGNVAVSMEGEPVVKLSEGDVLLFQADVAHTYRNIVDAQSVLYLVTSDPEPTER